METEQLNSTIERLIAVMSNRMPAQPFAAGGMGFTSGGGMAPFRGQEEYNTNRSYASMQMMQTITEHDFRTRALANAVQSSVQGRIDPNSAFYRTTQAFGGLMFNNPAFASITGGSALDMGFGIQNLMYQSGLRANGQRIYGGGAVTDAAAVNMFDRMQENFFDSKRGGQARLDKTFGADRTELGQIFSTLSQRGAFAGMDIGNISTVGSGGVQVGASDALTQKISSMTSEAAKTLRIVKDILGDRGTQELMRVAESLTGGSFSNVRDMTAMQRSIMGTLIQGQALGVDPRQALELRRSAAEAMMAQGFGGREAGSASGAIMPSVFRNFVTQQDYAAAADSRGFHVNQRSEAELTAAAAGQQGAMMKSHLFQAYAVAKNRLQEGELADNPRLAALLSKGTPTEEELKEIQQLTNASLGAGGVNRYVLNHGGIENYLDRNMSAATRDSVNNVARNVLDRRGLTTYMSENLKSASATLSLNSGGLKVSDIVKNLTWMNSTLELVNQEALQSAVSSGDKAKVREILKRDASGLTDKEIDEHADSLMSVRQGFSQNYAYMRGFRNSDPNGATNQSIGERVRHDRSVLKASDMFADMSVNGTMVDKMIRGFMGQKTITDKEIFDFARLGSIAGTASVGGFSTIKLDEKMTGLDKVLKAAGMTDAAIAEAKKELSDPAQREKTLLKLANQMRESGMSVGTRSAKDGHVIAFDVLSAAGRSTVKARMEAKERRLAEDDLLEGKDNSEGKTRESKATLEELRGDFGTEEEEKARKAKISEQVIKYATSKSSADKDRLKEYMKSNGNVALEAIEAQEAKLRIERDAAEKAGGESGKKTAKEKQDAIDQLESAKQSAADKFMGYLEVANPEKLLFAISQMISKTPSS